MAPLRSGINRLLEDEANRIIRESLRGVTRHIDKSDILTPWKEAERRKREVYPTSGVADASIRQGVFHRALNTSRPELNSRDGIARARNRNIGGSLAQFVSDNGVDD